MTTQKPKDKVESCSVCGTPMPDWEPDYCCSGRECCCGGLPIYPPWCEKCYKEIMSKDIAKPEPTHKIEEEIKRKED